MDAILLPAVAVGAAAFGVLLAAIAGARRRSELEDELAVRRSELAACRKTLDHMRPKPIPVNAIQTAVADCANKPANDVGQILEVLSAFPEWLFALTLRRKTLDELADPHAARTYATHGIHEARTILRQERGGK